MILIVSENITLYGAIRIKMFGKFAIFKFIIFISNFFFSVQRKKIVNNKSIYLFCDPCF